MNKKLIQLYEILEKIVVACETDIGSAEELMPLYDELCGEVYKDMFQRTIQLYKDCANAATRTILDTLANREIDDPFMASEKFRRIADSRKY
tara:strand:+ start:139 stop:414 length:276 start_codon:yes stop_codon:yes gene_type:complete